MVVFVFIGCSGVGKSTIQHSLPIPFLTNYTTREVRIWDGEIDGYHVKHIPSREEFMRLVDNGEMLEYAEYVGNLYGTPMSYIRNMIENKQPYHATKEINGVHKLRELLGEDRVVVIYIKAPNVNVLMERMKARGDSPEVIQKRITNIADTHELHNEKYADYVVVNNDLDTAILEVHQIVIKELVKRIQNKGEWYYVS